MLRIFQTLLGTLIIIISIIGFLESPSFTNLFCLIFGISLVPFLFDMILNNANISLNKSEKTQVKIGIFILFIIVANINRDQKQIDSTSLFRHQEITTLLTSKQRITTDDSLKLAKFIQTATRDLADKDYEALSNGLLKIQILKDSNANIILLNKMKLLTKSPTDFANKKEYWAYRANRAYSLGDLKAFDTNLTKAAFIENDDYKIQPYIYEDLLEYKRRTGDTENAYKICAIALKNNPKNERLIKILADLYFHDKKYKKAIKGYSRYLSIDKSNPAIHTNIGLAYEFCQNKSKAKKHYKSAIELEGKGGIACERLRELTVKIVRYRYYSECCDGSTSFATGRGACSHHQGVCRRMKEPITQYTMDCQ